ncbi:hypothetical protein JCM19294_1836 [Nonlabens tegetincola]|uniref:Uncharacterized protein n=1 Tax=Nonlabens tegetincola TaxID=323273 RepID=A0A090Q3K7_9FLAO|nr:MULTISPECIES: hypothetical protein [Nonlabens]MEE2801833.1 hypothetical protein [Bacteroidota bacterium]ALM21585.1 hypothetical protein AAT17_10240 [Nonlabens sp. MIC269]ARN71688.1 hypothetical protein BST91_08560 [Nonlabens tegetincola]PQJ14197.1 hypothetical protein BST93_13215 [Nonlabens tegetincola]GAK96323.1 hypothetical protein JCM19294_1836 [Nonlabens tegetincola]
MNDLTSQLSSIELKVKTLLQENARLRQELMDEKTLTSTLEKDNNELLQSLKATEDKMVALKTANAMLGSDEYKTKTKLKINALVKEIDKCIAQLT